MGRRILDILVIGSSLHFPENLKSAIEKAHYDCKSIYIQNFSADDFNNLRFFDIVVLNVNTPEAEELFKRIRKAFPDIYIIVYSLDKDIKRVAIDLSKEGNVGVVESTNIRGKTKQIMALILEFWKRRIAESK